MPKTPPKNPFYCLYYQLSVEGGVAQFNIPAPGGHVAPEDAKDLISLFGLIEKRMLRDIAYAEHNLSLLSQSEDSSSGDGLESGSGDEAGTPEANRR